MPESTRSSIDSRRALTRSLFGTTPEGASVEAFTIRNRNGVELRVITYGGIIQSLRTPDRNGAFADIVLGHDGLAISKPQHTSVPLWADTAIGLRTADSL